MRTTRKTKRLAPITDEEFELVNENNKDLIDDFLIANSGGKVDGFQDK